MAQHTITEGQEKDGTSPPEGQEPADIRPADASGEEQPGEPASAVAGETGAGQAEPVGVTDSSAGSATRDLLLDGETFQRRWREIQVLFVDEPQHAVEEADSLVSDMVREFADALTAQRSGIEHDLHDAGDVSTEDCRVALLRYRDVFRLLVSV